MAERLCRVGAGPDRRLRNARHPDEPALRGRSMTRVTNLAAQNLSLALLQQTQSRVMDAQVQISTGRSEEHTSELQSLMRISYAVFCLKKKKQYPETKIPTTTMNNNN